MSLRLDANIATYDPRDHFDDGYIAASWDRAKQNLAKFNADNSDWESLGAAGHAIGDFYAHSSYVHFAQLQNAATANGQATIYAPNVPLAGTPAYTSAPAAAALPPFDLTSGKFSINYNLCPGTGQDVANQWAGQLISGRYAQKYDPKAGFWEGLTSIPFSLSSAPDYQVRGLLPHHNEIAVDSGTPAKEHRLTALRSTRPRTTAVSSPTSSVGGRTRRLPTSGRRSTTTGMVRVHEPSGACR